MPSRKKKKEKNLGKLNRAHFTLLLIFSLVGLFIRIEPALHDAVFFGYDQGVDLSYVRRLVEEGRPSLIGRFTGLQGVFMGPLWTLILSVPYVLSGGNPTANLLFFSVIGVFAIWASFFVVRRMFSETEAILAAFFVAFSGPFVALSHVVLSPHPLVILMIPYVWFLWEIIENDNRRFWPWLGLLAGIFFQFEIGFAFFVLPATIVTLAAFKKPRPVFGKSTALAGGLFLLTFLPQILFELRHEFLMSKAIVGALRGENTSLGSEGVGIDRRLIIRAGSLWEDYAGAVTLKGASPWTTLFVSVPAIAGWWQIVRNNNRRIIRFGTMLVLFVTAMYVGFTVFPGPVWVWYRAGMPFIFVLLLVIGWAKILAKSSGRNWAAGVGLSILVFMSLNPRAYIIRAIEGEEGGVANIRNQKQALDVIFTDAGQEPFDLYVYTPPVYTYVWDHMLFWYAPARYTNSPEEYGYLRSPGAENDFYLLIEPDDIEARIDGWKGNFAKFGQISERWELPGEVRIEKWEAGEEKR